MSRERNEQRVIDAACQWWLSKRPFTWSLADHLKNPTVNMTTDWETKLARAVARYTEGGDRG